MLGWNRREAPQRSKDERLRDIRAKLQHFVELEDRFRVEHEAAQQERDNARIRDDAVNAEMYQNRVDLLQKFLHSIAKIRFVLDQVQYMVEFHDAMSLYGELRNDLMGAEIGRELKRALDDIHTDLEYIKGTSVASMEKLDRYFDSLRTSPAEVDSFMAPSGEQRASQKATSSAKKSVNVKDVEERLRRRLEDQGTY